MNPSRRNEIIVGLFVMLAFFTLFGMTYLIQGGFGPNYLSLQARFSTVPGLEVGSPVLVSGIRLGRVTAIDPIELMDEKTGRRLPAVIVTSRIERTVPLYRNAKVELVSQDFIGDKRLEISPGSTDAGLLADGEILDGIMPLSLGEVFDNAMVFVDELRKTNQLLQEVVGDPENKHNVSRLLRESADSVEKINALIAENREPLTRTIARLEEVANRAEETLNGANSQVSAVGDDLRGAIADLRTELKSFSERFRTLVDSVDGRAATLTTNADGLMTDLRAQAREVGDSLQRASDSLADVLERLRSGEGTAGRLLTDDQPFQDLRDSLSSLRRILSGEQSRFYDARLDYRAAPPTQTGPTHSTIEPTSDLAPPTTTSPASSSSGG